MTHVPESLSSRRTMSGVAGPTGSLADAFPDRGAAPGVQDVFLNGARRERLAVTLHLMTGQSFDARIKGFDRYAVIVDVNGVDHLVFKHAIAFIETAHATGGFAAPHP